MNKSSEEWIDHYILQKNTFPIFCFVQELIFISYFPYHIESVTMGRSLHYFEQWGKFSFEIFKV